MTTVTLSWQKRARLCSAKCALHTRPSWIISPKALYHTARLSLQDAEQTPATHNHDLFTAATTHSPRPGLAHRSQGLTCGQVNGVLLGGAPRLHGGAVNLLQLHFRWKKKKKTTRKIMFKQGKVKKAVSGGWGATRRSQQTGPSSLGTAGRAPAAPSATTHTPFLTETERKKKKGGKGGGVFFVFFLVFFPPPASPSRPRCSPAPRPAPTWQPQHRLPRRRLPGTPRAFRQRGSGAPPGLGSERSLGVEGWRRRLLLRGRRGRNSDGAWGRGKEALGAAAPLGLRGDGERGVEHWGLRGRLFSAQQQ